MHAPSAKSKASVSRIVSRFRSNVLSTSSLVNLSLSVSNACYVFSSYLKFLSFFVRLDSGFVILEYSLINL